MDISTVRNSKLMIKVIDAICGAGKSTKMFSLIRDMNKEDDSKKFLYITPFLSEIEERIPQELPELNFKNPVNRGSGKLSSLKELLVKGDNVASTHVLFGLLTTEIVDILIQKKYVLIIDEAINCVGLLDKELNHSDTSALLTGEFVIMDKEDRNRLIWNESKYPDHIGKYSIIRAMCGMGTVYCYADTFLMFEFPPKLLSALQEVYIITYLFHGSDMRCWLDLNKIEYQYLDNEVLGLRSEAEIKKSIKENLIFLTNRNLEASKQQNGTLSRNWFINAKKDEIDKYKAMMRSCVVSEKAKVGEIFWTTYKEFENKLAGDGYKKGFSKDMPSFLPCNTRATNKYRNYSLCMYAVNIFKNPIEVNYLKSQGIEPDEDMFSLSEAIQFIWRGSIREGKPMRLLVLSKRIRKLLEDWLEDGSN